LTAFIDVFSREGGDVEQIRRADGGILPLDTRCSRRVPAQVVGYPHQLLAQSLPSKSTAFPIPADGFRENLFARVAFHRDAAAIRFAIPIPLGISVVLTVTVR
jgi:hypothetical protein